MKEWKKSEPSDKALISCAVLIKSTGILFIFGGIYPNTFMYIVMTYLDIVISIFFSEDNKLHAAKHLVLKEEDEHRTISLTTHTG